MLTDTSTGKKWLTQEERGHVISATRENGITISDDQVRAQPVHALLSALPDPRAKQMLGELERLEDLLADDIDTPVIF